MKDPHSLRKLFVGALLLATLAYSSFTLVLYWEYVRLDKQAPLDQVAWAVESKDDEVHQLKATYQYRVGTTEYAGEYLFKKPVFINSLGAEHAIGDFSGKFHNAWLSSTDPTHSALEKNYPLKELISAAVLWCIVVYFITLSKIV